MTFIKLIFVFCLSAATAVAQIAGLEGQLNDTSGAVIPGAAVTISTGSFIRTVTSRADGTFALQGVPPGIYTLSVTAQGFEPQQKPVTLAAGQNAKLAMVLTLAATRQEMTVVSDGE